MIQEQLLETKKAVRRLEEERDKLFEQTQNLMQEPHAEPEPQRKPAQKPRMAEECGIDGDDKHDDSDKFSLVRVLVVEVVLLCE